MPNNAFEIVCSLIVLVIQVYMSALILGTLLNYLVRTDTILFTCVLRVSAGSLCLLLIALHLSNVGIYSKTSDPKVSNGTSDPKVFDGSSPHALNSKTQREVSASERAGFSLAYCTCARPYPTAWLMPV